MGELKIKYGYRMAIKMDRNLLFSRFINLAVRSYMETGCNGVMTAEYNFGRGANPKPIKIYIFKEDDTIRVMFEEEFERRNKNEEEFN